MANGQVTDERALLQERGDKYGTPGSEHPAALDNLRCADELIAVYQRYSKRSTHDGHDYAIIMVLAKIARMATGRHHDDNYTDGKAYLELARVAGGGSASS